MKTCENKFLLNNAFHAILIATYKNIIIYLTYSPVFLCPPKKQKIKNGSDMVIKSKTSVFIFAACRVYMYAVHSFMECKIHIFFAASALQCDMYYDEGYMSCGHSRMGNKYTSFASLSCRNYCDS